MRVMNHNRLYKMYWVFYPLTTFGSIWQPAKPKYGNYYNRGYNSRFRKMLKNK